MKIVVVGGGFGGVKTALELSNKPNMQVTLVSQTENFEYHGALYRSAAGRSPLEVVLPLRDIFKSSSNVEVVLDRITGLDSVKRRAVSEMGNIYPYDKLVCAMGNNVNYFGIQGVAEHSMSLDTISNTIALRYQLTNLFKVKSSKKIRILIIGAGPSGVELAGELQHFSTMVAERYKVPAKTIKLTLVEAAHRVLPALSEKASAKAAKRLERLGVHVMTETFLNSYEPGVAHLSKGVLSCDLVIWTAGSSTVGFYRDHPDEFKLEKGKVIVDQYLHVAGRSDIIVIGDNAATPHSGMAQTALHDAKFVARNILREHDGLSLRWYRAVQPIYVVPIGPNWAILQTKKRVISGYRAWVVRRRADLAIYRNFEPYKMALKTWRKGNRVAKF